MFRCDPCALALRTCAKPGDKTGRGGPVFDPELRVNVLEMFAHRGWRDFKNGCDVAVRFSLTHPE